MKFVEWSKEEILDVTDIDNQHQKIADIINTLYETLGTDKDLKAKLYCNDLVNVLKEHVKTEEDYMKANKYPNFISHKLEHDRFVAKVEKFNAEVQAGKVKVNLEFLKSAKNWLINHLDINDKKLGAFLVANGIVTAAGEKKVNV